VAINFLDMYIPTLDQAQKIIKQYGSPVYATDPAYIRQKSERFLQAFSRFNTKIFYAIKANYNPHIVKKVKESGIYGIDAVSPNEIRLALELGYKAEQIIYTPSNPSDEEIQYAGEKGVLQNLGSLSELERFGERFPGQAVSIRICPEVGEGESEKVTTGQTESKFGIPLSDLEAVKTITEKYKLKLIGIHSHIGSGFYGAYAFRTSIEAVCKVAKNFDSIEFLDFGGGFGVPYHPEKPEIDLEQFAEAIEGPIHDFNQFTGREVEVRLEPGKFLVGRSTVLLTTVTTLKEKGGVTFVGTDSGFHNLIRPAMYDAYHHVVNLSKPHAPKKLVQVVGNVCETCDIFNKGIELGMPEEGDVLAILVAGGYGAAMSSNYNIREYIAEVMVEEDAIQLIRKKQTYEQVMEDFISPY